VNATNFTNDKGELSMPFAHIVPFSGSGYRPHYSAQTADKMPVQFDLGVHTIEQWKEIKDFLDEIHKDEKKLDTGGFDASSGDYPKYAEVLGQSISNDFIKRPQKYPNSYNYTDIGRIVMPPERVDEFVDKFMDKGMIVFGGSAKYWLGNSYNMDKKEVDEHLVKIKGEYTDADKEKLHRIIGELKQELKRETVKTPNEEYKDMGMGI
jgi:hypothetical protein